MGDTPIADPADPTAATGTDWGASATTGAPLFFPLAAIFLPAAALLVELAGGTIHNVSGLDPIPTVLHVIAIVCVPAGLAFVEGSLGSMTRAPSPGHARVLLFANAIATFVAVAYSIAFLPLIPLGLLGIMLIGLGFLVLSPYFAMAAALEQGVRLRRALAPIGVRVAWPYALALALVASALVGPMLPRAIASHCASCMDDTDPAARARAVSLARACFAESIVLERCYHIAPMRVGPVRIFGGDRDERPRTALDRYRRLYFLMTGRPFNSVPPPSASPVRERWRAEWTLDAEIGGDTVAARVRGLSLVTSDLDVRIEAKPALATVGWTFTFRNEQPIANEARTRIVLPPDAVASDLSLWINGEERPAAFGTRGQVKAAYQDVAVRRRLDPALLTTAGPGRLQLQCFPVPPRGRMKTRVRFTVPLVGLDGFARLRLPQMAERNFSLAAKLVHGVRVRSDVPVLDGPIDVAEPADDTGLFDGRGFVERLAGASLAIASPAEGAERVAERDGFSVRARWLGHVPAPFPKVVLVVEDAASLASAGLDWNAVLDAMPASTQLLAIAAGTSTRSWRPSFEPATPENRAALADWLGGLDYVGGADPVPALIDALDRVANDSDTAIVWVGGPVPVRLSEPEPLDTRLNASSATVFRVAIAPGSNRVVEALTPSPRFRVVPTFNDAAGAIARVLRTGSAIDSELKVRVIQPPKSGREALGDPLLILGAREVVDLQLHRGAAGDVTTAQRIATGARIVTPVSGAVVLETKAQYDRHGLDPSSGKDPGSVPAIPEPETWALLAIALLALVWVIRRRA